MIQHRKETQAVETVVVDNLEPYLRLIELQKQMIELVRQHARTKDECAALRSQLLDEMTRLRRSRRTWREAGRPWGAWLRRHVALWIARKEPQPQSVPPFLAQNRLIKI